MKKTLLFLFLAINHFLQSQTSAFPDFINYQAVLRDVNGVVLPAATSGQLTFKIYDDLAAAGPSYEENHNFVTNTAGLVNVKIGGGTPVGSTSFTNVNWSAGKACYEVFLNGNSIGGKQAFATVPYAIYARNSGGSLPTGSANQTLYWDGSTNKWIPTSNLNNNGTNLGIGVAANPTGNKLHVFSNSLSDSSVIFSVKNNSVGRGAAIRAYGLGSTNANSPMTSQAIYGLDSYGGNGGTGPGVGVSGYGSSSGYAYGVVGIGSVNSATASAIGLYGGIANGASNPGSYAAYLNGKTFIGDSLIYFPAPNAYTGKVLTMQAGGFAAWRSLSSIPSASISMSQGGIVNVNPIGNASSFTISAQAPVFSNTGIGTIVAGAYPNYALNVPAPSLSISGNAITLTQGTVVTTQTIATLSGLGTTGYLPQYSSPNSFSITNIFRDNNSRVGFNTIAPKTMLHLVKQSGSDTLLLESQTAASMGFALKNINNRFGMVLNGTNFKIEENGVDRMIFNTGRVGVGVNPLTDKFEVDGKTFTDSLRLTTSVTPSVGAVLVSRDAVGNTKWSGPVVFKGVFSPTAGYAITNTGSLTVGGTTGYSGSVPYNTTGFSNGTLFSAGSMKFKAPQTGYYHIESNVAVVFSTSAGPVITIELVNLTTTTSIQTNKISNPNPGTAVNTNAFISSVVLLNANDEVIVRLYGNVTATGNVVAGNSNYISGNLIR